MGEPIEHDEADQQYVTAIVDDQLFGIPILRAQDILAPRDIAPIPLAPDYVAGMMNLRGRIVTAIDLRRRLNFEPADRTNSPSIVINHGGEQYGVLVDEIGEIREVPADCLEANPPTLDRSWGRLSRGICRLDGAPMVILNVDQVLDHRQEAGPA